MPKKLKSCVDKLTNKGYPPSSAWPICIKSTGQNPEPKKKGKK